MTFEIPRRRVFTGALAAPFIAKLGLLMPVRRPLQLVSSVSFGKWIPSGLGLEAQSELVERWSTQIVASGLVPPSARVKFDFEHPELLASGEHYRVTMEHQEYSRGPRLLVPHVLWTKDILGSGEAPEEMTKKIYQEATKYESISAIHETYFT